MTADRAAGNLAWAAEQVISRTVELSQLPAPPGQEQDRATLVRDWWTADRLAGVQLDRAGNVRAQLRAGAPGQPAVLVCAHLDTVFGPEVRHGLTLAGGRLTGPGAGDDTVAVCSLGVLDGLLPSELRHPVWIVATVGEEGLGNLAGVRALLADPPGPVRAVIALEGNYLGRVNITGVGSVRWQVTVTAPGGHAWEDAAAPSAVHEAARLVTQLATLARPAPAPGDTAPKTTVNIGRLAGGESVNSRGQHAEFLVDLRSGDAGALQSLTGAASAVLRTVAPPGRGVGAGHRRPPGRRPGLRSPAGHAGHRGPLGGRDDPPADRGQHRRQRRLPAGHPRADPRHHDRRGHAHRTGMDRRRAGGHRPDRPGGDDHPAR